MTAIVLAAGQGRRLGRITASCPKCLLHVGGEPILNAALSRIRTAGIRHVTIVVGFEADRVRRHVRGLDLGEVRVSFQDNHEFDRTNNLHSLAIALDRTDGPVTIINGDNLFNEGILKALLTADASAAAVVDYGPLSADAMRVEIEDGRVMAMGKQLAPDRAAGNAIGMYRFDADVVDALRDEVFTRVARREFDAFYVEAIAALATRLPIQAIPTGGMTWCEVDDALDLELAPARLAAILAEEWVAATLAEPLVATVLAGASAPGQRLARIAQLKRLIESGSWTPDLAARFA